VAPGPLAVTTTPPVGALSTEHSTSRPAFFRTVANLGIQAAEALEHAHSLGVIHRDIKPGNLMVDARGNLWITDFGLAHCQGAVELTMSGDLLGTLRYMSPEQALAQRVLVDQRTDIYSLGATLYELLTLEPAYPATDRRELLRQIAFDDPKPPRRLSKAIPVELETIILKAMEKNPTDRYATAQELADDLGWYLENKPIRARRPNSLARLRKWSYRHRGPVSAAVISAVVVLAATSGFVAWQWLVAVEAKSLAETRRIESEQAASTVRAINQFLINDLLNAGTPQQTLGKKVTVEEVLDNAERKIGAAFPGQPLVEAGIRMAIGSAYDNLGLYPKAERHFQRALTIRQELLGGEHRDTLEALKELGSLWADQNRYQEAEELCRKTLDTARRVLGDDDKLTLSLEHIIADVVMEQDRLDESEELLRRCLQRETRILGEEDRDTLDTMSNLSRLLGERRGNWQEAERLGQRCMEVRERVLTKEHPDTLLARNNFADSILRMEGKWLEAEELHRETLKIARRVLGPKHDTTLTVEHNLAIILMCLDKLDEAEKCFRECVQGRTSILGRENPEVLRSRKFLAEVLYCCGKWDEADKEFREVLEVNRRVMGPDEASTLSTLAGIASVHRAKGNWDLAEETLRQALKTCRQSHGAEDLTTLFLTSNLAAVLEDEGKHSEARSHLQTMLETQRKRLPPGHPSLAGALYRWAEHLLAVGEDLHQAETDLDQAIRIERAALPPGHRLLALTLAAQGWLYARSGRATQGEPLLRESLDICRHAFPEGTWPAADTESRLGGCLTALRKFTEAEPLLLSGYQGLQSTPGAPLPRKLQAGERIVKLYETWGKADKAAEWRAKLLPLPKPPEKGTETQKDK
jgi:tetratricopeptide (TPR) repeat protein